MTRTILLLLVTFLLLAGCDPGSKLLDAGTPDAGTVDASTGG